MSVKATREYVCQTRWCRKCAKARCRTCQRRFCVKHLFRTQTHPEVTR